MAQAVFVTVGAFSTAQHLPETKQIDVIFNAQA
jgi:hypothetical protein